LYIHVYDGPQPKNICGGEMMCEVVFETIKNRDVGKKGVTREFGPGASGGGKGREHCKWMF
jgi:hypothetical protein